MPKPTAPGKWTGAPDGKTPLEKTMDLAQGVEPDQAAKVAEYSDKTGQPASTVATNLPAIQEAAKSAPKDYLQNIQMNYPGTADFLSDPTYAAAAKPDVDAGKIDRFESMAKEHGVLIAWAYDRPGEGEQALEKDKALLNLLEQAFYTGGSNLSRVPAYLYNAQFSYDPDKQPGAAYGLSFGPATGNVQDLEKKWDWPSQAPDKWVNNSVSQWFDKGVQETLSKSEALKDPVTQDYFKALLGGDFAVAGKAMDDPARFGKAIAANIIVQTPTLAAAAALGPEGGAGMFGGLQAGQSTKENFDAGMKGPANAENATFKAVVAAAVMHEGTLKVIGSIGKRQIQQQVVESALTALGKSTGLVMAQGSVQSAANNIIDYSTGKNDHALDHILGESAAAGLQNLPMGLGFGLIHAGTRANINHELVTASNLDFQEKMESELKNLNLAKTSLPLTRELLANSFKNRPPEFTHIPEEAFTQYFQSQNMDPVKVADSLGVRQSLQEARENRGDVRIPTADWATKMDEVHRTALKNDVRYDPVDQLTPNQLKEEKEKTAQAAQQEGQKGALEMFNQAATEPTQLDDSAKRVQSDIYQQMKSAGRPEKEALAGSIVAARMFRTLAANGAVSDPLDFYRKQNIRIIKPGGEVPTAAPKAGEEPTKAPVKEKAPVEEKKALAVEMPSHLDTENALRKRLAEAERRAQIAEKKSRTDPLTGMPNKTAFLDDTELGMKGHARVDLDLFKEVNDTYGHDVVDKQILPRFAEKFMRLAGKLGGDENTRTYRFGGDEFDFRTHDVDGLRTELTKFQQEIKNTPFALKLIDENGNETYHEVKGLGFSFGTGEHENEDVRLAQTEKSLRKQKEDRVTSGERRARGQGRLSTRPLGETATSGMGPGRPATEETTGGPGEKGQEGSSDMGGQGLPGAGIVPSLADERAEQRAIERGEKPETLYQSAENAPPFYSKLEKTIEQKMGNSATADQVRGLIKDLPQEERKWSGIDDFLKDNPKPTKTDLLDFLRANNLKIKETALGGEFGTKPKNELAVRPNTDLEGKTEEERQAQVKQEIQEESDRRAEMRERKKQEMEDSLPDRVQDEMESRGLYGGWYHRENADVSQEEYEAAKKELEPLQDRYEKTKDKLQKIVKGYDRMKEEIPGLHGARGESVTNEDEWNSRVQASNLPEAVKKTMAKMLKNHKTLVAQRNELRSRIDDLEEKTKGRWELRHENGHNPEEYFETEEEAERAAQSYNEDEENENYREISNEIGGQDYEELERIKEEDEEDLDRMAHDGQVEVREDFKDKNKAKFGQYKLPGGENYREVLFQLPPAIKPKFLRESEHAYHFDLNGEETPVGKGVVSSREKAQEYMERYALTKNQESNFKSAHFDQTNIVAHTRIDDRTDSEGKKVLFVEEIQSDWHQKGRKGGYRPEIEALDKRREEIENKGNSATEGEKKEWAEIKNKLEGSEGVPDAPFKKTWHEFVMKRLIREAAEKGYDKVGWTTGEQQADRYSLQKHIDSLHYTNDGALIAEDKNGRTVFSKSVSEKEIET